MLVALKFVLFVNLAFLLAMSLRGIFEMQESEISE